MRDQVEPAQRIDLLLALGQAQTRSDENIKAKRTIEQAADVASLAYHSHVPPIAQQSILSPILAGRSDELIALRRWLGWMACATATARSG